SLLVWTQMAGKEVCIVVVPLGRRDKGTRQETRGQGDKRRGNWPSSSVSLSPCLLPCPLVSSSGYQSSGLRAIDAGSGVGVSSAAWHASASAQNRSAWPFWSLLASRRMLLELVTTFFTLCRSSRTSA